MSDQIFISYRRNDAAYVTGHINDLLRKEFGNEAVFTDVDNIALGVDFRAVIDETVSQCQVFLAVIGTGWLSALDHEGKPRLQNPADFVRVEVESALKRNIPVIPLLVSGAQMPAAEDLPESLRDLAYRNGIPIRPAPDFVADMARLTKNLKKHFGALRAASDPVEQAEAEAALADKLQEASTASKDASARDSSTNKDKPARIRIQVEEDDRARKQAQLGIGQQKKRRWAASLWGLAIVMGAAGGWFYIDQNPDALQGLLSGGQSAPTENEAGVGDSAGPGPAAGDAAAEGSDVFAPTSFAPAATTDAREQPGTDPEVDATAGLGSEAAPDDDTDSVADGTAVDVADESTAVSTVAAGDAPVEVPEVAPDPEVQALAESTEPAASTEDVVEETGSAVAASNDAAVDAVADDEVTLTPGSQRQSDASALIGDGVRLAGVGDHEAAIQNFTEALTLDVEPAFVYKQRGASYRALGQYGAAVQDYSQAIQLNSEDPVTLYNRGVAYIALQDYAAAIADFDAVVELDPEFVDAYSRRADAHEASGNTEAAIRDRAIVSVFESNRDTPR